MKQEFNEARSDCRKAYPTIPGDVLDDIIMRTVGMMGQAARAQGGQGAEPIGWVHSKHLKELERGRPIHVYHRDTPVVFDSKVPVYTQPQPAMPEGYAFAPTKLIESAIRLMRACGCASGWHESADELERYITTTPKPTATGAGAESISMPQNAEQARAMALVGHRWLEDNAPELITTQPTGGECEPDFFWNADNPEDGSHEDEHSLADWCAQDLPFVETMVVDVGCAKRLPSRQMKIWLDDDEDLQWEWVTQPPQDREGGE